MPNVIDEISKLRKNRYSHIDRRNFRTQRRKDSKSQIEVLLCCLCAFACETIKDVGSFRRSGGLRGIARRRARDETGRCGGVVPSAASLESDTFRLTQLRESRRVVP